MTGLVILAGSLAYGLGTLSASVPRWIALYLFAAYVIGAFCLHLWRRRAIRFGETEAYLSIFLGYCALSLSWSGDWRQGIVHFMNMGTLAALFLYVRHARPSVGMWVQASVVGALALEFLFPADHGGFGNRNFITEYLLIALPLMWLGNRYSAAVLSLGCAVYLVGFNPSHIEFLVLVACLGAVALWLFSATWFESFALMGLGLLALFLTVPESHFLARYELWIQTLFMWLDHPLLGVGIGSFDYAHFSYREAHVPYLGEATILTRSGDYAGAAHNEILQSLANFGILGTGIAALFLVSILGRQQARIARPEVWCLGVTAIVGLIGFPLQNPQTALLVAIALGLAAKPVPYDTRLPRFSALPGPLLIGALLFASFISYKAAVVFTLVPRNLATAPHQAMVANFEAYRTNPLAAEYRSQLPVTLAAAANHFRDRIAITKEAADFAYEIGRTAGPDNPAILVARAEMMINSGQDARKEVEHLQRVARLLPETWLLQAGAAAARGDGQRLSEILSHRKCGPFEDQFQQFQIFAEPIPCVS